MRLLDNKCFNNLKIRDIKSVAKGVPASNRGQFGS